MIWEVEIRYELNMTYSTDIYFTNKATYIFSSKNQCVWNFRDLQTWIISVVALCLMRSARIPTEGRAQEEKKKKQTIYVERLLKHIHTKRKEKIKHINHIPKQTN